MNRQQKTSQVIALLKNSVSKEYILEKDILEKNIRIVNGVQVYPGHSLYHLGT